MSWTVFFLLVAVAAVQTTIVEAAGTSATNVLENGLVGGWQSVIIINKKFLQ
jgi:hypothetical protein